MPKMCYNGLGREAGNMALSEEKTYTIDDIYALPDGQRAELIDGKMYMMTPPTTRHQRIVLFLSRKIADYIDAKGGDCEVFVSPFAVFLETESTTNYVEPDLAIVCDPGKIDERGCHGAPDWVIEVVSPSTKGMDYGRKQLLYFTAGVREYWVVDPAREVVIVYQASEEWMPTFWRFRESIPIGIYGGDLCVTIS